MLVIGKNVQLNLCNIVFNISLVNNNRYVLWQYIIDSVNFTRYPEMAAVKYHVVNLTAGDCLYIPYKWYAR